MFHFENPYDERYDPDFAPEPFDSFDPASDTPTHEVVFADDGSHAGYVYSGERVSSGYSFAAATGRTVVIRRI